MLYPLQNILQRSEPQCEHRLWILRSVHISNGELTGVGHCIELLKLQCKWSFIWKIIVLQDRQTTSCLRLSLEINLRKRNTRALVYNLRCGFILSQVEFFLLFFGYDNVWHPLLFMIMSFKHKKMKFNNNAYIIPLWVVLFTRVRVFRSLCCYLRKTRDCTITFRCGWIKGYDTISFPPLPP